ncbi:hypothetical protein V8E36_004667 [Tilletia maclaganii]
MRLNSRRGDRPRSRAGCLRRVWVRMPIELRARRLIGSLPRRPSYPSLLPLVQQQYHLAAAAAGQLLRRQRAHACECWWRCRRLWAGEGYDDEGKLGSSFCPRRDGREGSPARTEPRTGCILSAFSHAALCAASSGTSPAGGRKRHQHRDEQRQRRRRTGI